MFVGTGDVPSTLGFYHKCGFSESHRVENFFIDNYDHVMIEDGMICMQRFVTETRSTCLDCGGFEK